MVSGVNCAKSCFHAATGGKVELSFKVTKLQGFDGVVAVVHVPTPSRDGSTVCMAKLPLLLLHWASYKAFSKAKLAFEYHQTCLANVVISWQVTPCGCRDAV